MAPNKERSGNKTFKCELAKIAWDGSTIQERLASIEDPLVSVQEDPLISSRIARWLQVVEDNQRSLLNLDSKEKSTLTVLLGSRNVFKYPILSSWCRLFNEVIDYTTSSLTFLKGNRVKLIRPYLNKENPVPFEELLVPFIDIAEQKLRINSGNTFNILTKDALADLQSRLLLDLSSLSTRAFFVEFLRWQGQPLSGWDRLANMLSGNKPRRVKYYKFVRELLNGGILTFFKDYSVLARLLSVVTEQWIESTGELLDRLEKDKEKIQKKFDIKGELGQIIHIKPCLSDRHNGGRSVSLLHFSSDLKLIYKPRDVGIEAAFNSLLEWLNSNDPPFFLKTVKIVEGESYGWLGFIEWMPSETIEEVLCFYKRVGGLLAIVYVLDGTDFHYENFVAHRDHPVLVDVETIMQPNLPKPSTDSYDHGFHKRIGNYQLADSILRTGLLPVWNISPGKHPVDLSGLGCVESQTSHFKSISWLKVNTDEMMPIYEYSKIYPCSNVVRLNGRTILPNNFADIITDGFQQMYRFIIKCRDKLLENRKPFLTLSSCSPRIVLRPTSIYRQLQERLLHPKYLKSGVDRSIELEILGKYRLESGLPVFLNQVLNSEVQAMEKLDIPIFHAKANRLLLLTDFSRIIGSCFESPSWDRVLTRLKNLSEEDLLFQTNIMKMALAYRMYDISFASWQPEKESSACRTFGKSSNVEFSKEAIAIADLLCDRVIQVNEGVTWLTLEKPYNSGVYEPYFLTPSLYNGSLGIALFLSATFYIQPRECFRKLAIKTVELLRKELGKCKQPSNEGRTDLTGGYLGLGGIVYALTKMSKYLGDESLLSDAVWCTSQLTDEFIKEDKVLDVIGGSAGTILGLLTLFDVTSSEIVLERAMVCGNHLLKQRTRSKEGYRIWTTLQDMTLTGFSHGASGFCLALLRLYQRTKLSIFLEAAEEAIAYEKSVFIPDIKNWPDFRHIAGSEKTTVFACSWCHGAPGIGMARLGALEIMDDPIIREDIDAALETTINFNFASVDHLCCGNFGRIDFLLQASLKLSLPELRVVVTKYATRLVENAKSRGCYQFFEDLPGRVCNPGLFRGIAGVGYELLRLDQPDLIPSVLQFN